jgi:hypothetical protein
VPVAQVKPAASKALPAAPLEPAEESALLELVALELWLESAEVELCPALDTPPVLSSVPQAARPSVIVAAIATANRVVRVRRVAVVLAAFVRVLAFTVFLPTLDQCCLPAVSRRSHPAVQTLNSPGSGHGSRR